MVLVLRRTKLADDLGWVRGVEVDIVGIEDGRRHYPKLNERVSTRSGGWIFK